MKKFLFVVFIFLPVCIACATDTQSDSIHQYLTEYIDGKKTGSVMYIEVKIFKIRGKMRWLYSETRFNSVNSEKIVTVSMQQSRSNDDYSEPLLKDVVWVPGEKFECVINQGMANTVLKAVKKDKGKKYDWTVYGSMKYRLKPGQEEHFLELKGSKDTELQFRKMRLVNLYYFK
jgi:hypothetical protein